MYTAYENPNIESEVEREPQLTIEAYRQMKIEILKDFCIPVTETIIDEINYRESEIAIDNYCNYIIHKFLNKPQMRNKNYLDLISKCPNMEMIDEDVIIKCIGERGFYDLKAKGHIKCLGYNNGMRCYEI